MIKSLRWYGRRLRCRPALKLVSLAVTAALIAAGPVRTNSWSSGTDRAELADMNAASLDVKPFTTIAEIAAGDGYMAVRVAEKVAPKGRLYTV